MPRAHPPKLEGKISAAAVFSINGNLAAEFNSGASALPLDWIGKDQTRKHFNKSDVT